MSVESFGFKFVVDAKDAAKGYGDFQRAIDGVFASMQRFEQQAKKSLDAVTASSKRGQGDIQKYAAQFKALQNIPIDGSAAPKLLKLADAMAKFKAPNSTHVSNLRGFFNTLSRLPDLGGTTRSISNIAKLSAAMNGFKAPSSAQAVKLVEFAKALEKVGPGLASLSRVSGVSGIANELASISIALGKLKIPSANTANNLKEFSRALQMMRLGGAGNATGMLEALSRMNGFKAPTQAQTRNLEAFVNAVNRLKVPENAGHISSYLMQIAEAANRANGSLQGFRGGLNSLGYGMKNVPWGAFNQGAHKARLEMMGLQNAFSGTFQVGSLLRSLLGSLTIGELGRAFFDATQAANQFHASMEVLGQSPMMQSQEWERVRADANHFGMDLKQYSEQFSKFAVAAHESGTSLKDSFKIFEGFSTVMSAMHLGQEQQQSVGLAIREMMDQGYVSTQRLTRQLGLVLPGATATLLKAWKESGKSQLNLWDALKKKMVDSQWALDVLAAHYKTVYGPALKAALESPIQQFNILRNNITELMVQVGNDGAKKAFADFIAKLSGGLDPSHMKAFAQSIANGLVAALHRAGDAVDWLRANWDKLRGPLGAAVKLIGEWMVISSAFKIGAALITPLLSVRRAFLGFNDAMLGTQKTTGIMRKSMDELTKGIQPLPTGLARVNIAAQATAIKFNVATVATNAFKMAGQGLMQLFGGPLGLALTAATVLIGAATSAAIGEKIATNELTSSLADAVGQIKDQNTALDQAAVALGKTSAQGANAADAIHGMGGAAGSATSLIDVCGNAAKTAADKFFDLAMKARAAMLEMNNEKINELQNKAQGALDSTSIGQNQSWAKKMGFLGYGGTGFKSLKDFGSSMFGAIGSGLYSAYDNGESDEKAISEAAKTAQQIKQLRAQNDKINNTPLNILAGSGYGGNNDPPDKTDSIYHGSDGSGHHKKGKDLQKALEAFQNQMSEIMDKLMDGDPVGKLTAHFVQEITKQGQVLLNTKSYNQFTKNLAADAKNGKVSVDALIHALENGGIKGKALKDLKDRYGTDVQGIIRLLKKEQNEYEDGVKEATAKALKETYKGVDDAMKKIAEHNPLMKAQLEFADNMAEQAQKFLNSDAFIDWMKHTEEDADGATTALDRLIKALKEGKLAAGVVEGLRARNMNIGQVIGALQADGAGEADVETKAKRSMTFGADTIAEMQKQYEMEGLLGTKGEVLTKLQEEYNKAVDQHHKPTQQMLDDMAQQISYWDKMIIRQKAMKEFYENNGIKSYMADIKTAGQFVHEFDNNFLKGLEDTLYTLGTTGKLSFKNLFDSMQSQIVRFASQGLTERFAKLLSPHWDDPNNKNPTIFGFMGKMFGGKGGNGYQDSNKTLLEMSQATPMRVHVDNLGQLHAGGGAVPDAGAGMGDGSGGGLFDWLNGPTPDFSNASLSPDAFDPSKMFDFTGIGDEFKTTFDSIQPEIASTFNQTFKGLGGSFGGIFQSILGSLTGGGGGSGMGGGLMSLFGSLFGGGGGGGMMDFSSLLGGGGADFSSLLGGGADLSSMMDFSSILGFAEGGISTQGVGRQYRMSASAFVNAPHYSEGTENTSGIPAVLHDNEAVIPLSRNRKVPVQLTGGGNSGNGQVIQNFNITSPDADSFRKSKTQIATELHSAGARCWSRNNT